MKAKASLLESVLLPGQDRANVYEFYDLIRLTTKGNLVFRLKAWKALGYCFLVFVLLSILFSVIEVIIWRDI